jgi:hypothetical protein
LRTVEAANERYRGAVTGGDSVERADELLRHEDLARAVLPARIKILFGDDMIDRSPRRLELVAKEYAEAAGAFLGRMCWGF